MKHIGSSDNDDTTSIDIKQDLETFNDPGVEIIVEKTKESKIKHILFGEDPLKISTEEGVGNQPEKDVFSESRIKEILFEDDSAKTESDQKTSAD